MRTTKAAGLRIRKQRHTKGYGCLVELTIKAGEGSTKRLGQLQIDCVVTAEAMASGSRQDPLRRRLPRHPTLCSQETLPHEAGNLDIADAVNAWGCLQGRKGGSHGLQLTENWALASNAPVPASIDRLGWFANSFALLERSGKRKGSPSKPSAFWWSGNRLDGGQDSLERLLRQLEIVTGLHPQPEPLTQPEVTAKAQIAVCGDRSPPLHDRVDPALRNIDGLR